MTCRLALIFVGCFSAACDGADERVLHFPGDRAIGIVHYRPAIQGSYQSTIYNDWETVGAAKGDVALPGETDVRLDISRAASTDLSFLQNLQKGDVQVLRLKDTDVTDEQLQYVGHLRGLRILDLDSCRITDAGIEHLRGLTKLQEIRLSAFDVARHGFGVGDAAMAVLVSMPELKTVKLRLTQVSDAGLDLLTQAKSLQSIGLAGTNVTDAGMASLLQLPELRSLRLGVYDEGADITDQGLEYIGQIRTLEHLDLSGTEVTDEGLEHLRSLTNLKSLSLDETGVTEAGLVHLKPLTSLERLRFYGSDVTDAGAAHLAKITSLKEISSNLDVTDVGITLLAQLPLLERLSVSDEGVTDACLPHIAEMSSLKELWFQSCGITDEGLAQITRLKNLERLLIHRTNVTGDGLRHLRELPDLRILSVDFGERGDAFWCDRPHLRHVGEISTLTHLSVNGEKLTARDLRDLNGLVRLESLDIQDEVPVDDEASVVIGGITSLTHLEIDNGVMTDEGLVHLSNLHRLEILQMHGHFTDGGLLPLHKLQSLRQVSLVSPYVLEQSGDLLAAAIPSLRRAHVSVGSSRIPAYSLNARDDIRRKGLATERLSRDLLEGKLPPPTRLAGWMNVSEAGLKIDDLMGQVVLVDFWGTWCGPCIAAMPELRELHEKYSSQGLVILGIHTSDEHEEMPPFVEAHDIPWPVAYDVDDQTNESWEVDSYPSYYLIDRSGRLRIADILRNDLERAVFNLLNENHGP